MKKLSEHKKKLLREFVDWICEGCHKHEDEVGTLHAHRIRRGHLGGLYELRNIKMVCEKCHRVFHYREF
jgi:hypothetical protein